LEGLIRVRLTPKQAMLMAIEEGKKGAGFVSPNPMVGCVILDKEARLIGVGYHTRLGGDHAEIAALKSVEDQAALEGAQVFVTLEPCAHEGRTPSCAKALAKLPFRSVTYGLMDPNPLVAGQGAAHLRGAGIQVTQFADLQDELEELSEIFLLNMRQKRAFAALKVASSLDGKIALADGTSKWITGPEARDHVQYLRGCYDAVLIGAGTFLQDDPRLNARDPRFAEKRQRVVILDPQGVTFARLKGSALLSVRAPEDVIAVSERPPPVEGIRHIRPARADAEYSLTDLMRRLPQENIHSVLVEGGGATFTSFLRQGLADRLYLFVAPKLIGDGLPWYKAGAPDGLEAAPKLELLRAEKFGTDLMLTGRLAART
jgi:diaminohydroxyphosphoribosylaminopyrimidine deaminase/5-amino-6-(5-phosphoribosylamino)uracil reductase